MYKINCFLRKFPVHCKYSNLRFLSQKLETDSMQQQTLLESDQEWRNAKPYSELPGLSKWTLPFLFLPGGKLHNIALSDLHQYLRDTYGSIARFPAMLGRPDILFSFDPDDFEKVFRTEGIWPIRMGLDSFTYYRKHVRPDVFKGLGGLASEQGQSWGELRTKVNPILMKPQTVLYNLPQVNEIALEFLERINEIRDPSSCEMPANFLEEVNRWALESMCCIALNTRLGLICNREHNPMGTKIVNAMNDFSHLSYQIDMLPSIWRYYQTRTFKKLMDTYETVTEIITHCINEAVEKSKGSDDIEKSAFGKLLKIDKRAAIVMGIDMLMAGIETTSSALIEVLYYLAKNPDKQKKLRKELLIIMPKKDTPLTQETMKNLPYLRACIKETLRLAPILAANLRHTGQNIVLSGYQIPKGTPVMMNSMILYRDEQHFPQSNRFIPERWLKNISSSDDCPSAKSTHPFLYLPFGFGPRTCIGKRIAQMEIEVLTSRIIRNYHVSWNYPDMKYKNTMIIAPASDLKFKLEPI